MASSKTQKAVLMICGDYMEDFEAMVPFQALQAYGVSVDAVCPGKKAGEICRTAVFQLSIHQAFSETRGHNFRLNATFDEIEASNYDGLIIPGGRAPEYLATIESVTELASKFARAGKPIASICHGSLILAAADSLRGKTCTAFPSLKSVVVAAGAHWVQPQSIADCVEDGNFVTGVTYEGNPQFIQLFVKALGGTVSGSDNKRVLILCGDYTEEYELMVPFQSLQALGCHVDAVCPKKVAGDTCITGIHEYESGEQTYNEKPGYNFPITESFEGVNTSRYDALVVPGGRAPEYLSLNEDVLAMVKDFMDAGKPVASIGHGQMILSAADVLKGRECTGHLAVKLHAVMAGAKWLKPEPIDICYTDRNLVTAAGWHGHPQFISQLMALLGIQVSF